MAGALAVGEVVVADDDPRAAVDGFEHDLDPAPARPDDLRRVLPAPGELEAPRRVERDERRRPSPPRCRTRCGWRRPAGGRPRRRSPSSARAARARSTSATPRRACTRRPSRAPRSRHRSPPHPSPASVRRLSSSIATRSASSCSSQNDPDPVTHGDEAVAPRAVPAPGPVATLVDEPRRAQHGEVLADRRARHGEPGRDLAGGQLAIAELAQDRAPPRLGEGVERGIEHGRTLASAYVSVN